MYGVPVDLNLSDYVDATCTQVILGEFQIQIHFTPIAAILIEGRWELRDGHGEIIDRHSSVNADREFVRLHVLLGQSVASSNVNDPSSFSLTFESGHVFEIFDDSDEYESCQLSPSVIII